MHFIVSEAQKAIVDMMRLGYDGRMKYVLLTLLFLPSFVFAHTSDERYVDGYIVDMSTAPVAPWVGEKTGMSFVFRDPISGSATSTVKSAVMSIDALIRANKKPSEVVFTSMPFTVVNGGFATDYFFAEEGTYDLHLSFVDEKGVTHLAGFRKQVREGSAAPNSSLSPLTFLATIFITSMLAFFAGRFSTRSSSAKSRQGS